VHLDLEVKLIILAIVVIMQSQDEVYLNEVYLVDGTTLVGILFLDFCSAINFGSILNVFGPFDLVGLPHLECLLLWLLLLISNNGFVNRVF
jgi:hypothetical protein